MLSIEENLYVLGRIERQTRRALAIRSFWKSSTQVPEEESVYTQADTGSSASVPMSMSDADSSNNTVTIQTNGSDNTTPVSSREQSSQQQMLDINSLEAQNNLGCLSNLAAPYDQDTLTDTNHRAKDRMSKRRLCQTLLLPVILGLLIFLAALCSHQVNLTAISYDALVMIVALTIILIVMSSLAMWATYDNADDSNENERPIVMDNLRYHSYFDATIFHNCIDALIENRRPTGSTNVAVIDCKPPDYYNAIRNSKPVAKTPDSKPIIDQTNHSQSDYSFPPKYSDLDILLK